LNLKHYRQRLDELIAKREHVLEQVKEEQHALATAEDSLVYTNEAHQIILSIAQNIQQEAHDRIAGVVSRCLRSVFGEDAYEFRIHFERKRGRTEARLVFVRDTHEINPRSGSGGGVIDVAAFALRLASMMLSKPSPRRVLILDEPFKFVHSAVYRERVRIMLETLAKEMDFQLILSTGLEEYQIGKVIEV